MPKRYSANEKAQIVLEALKEEKTIAQIAAEHKVHLNQNARCNEPLSPGVPSIDPSSMK